MNLKLIVVGKWKDRALRDRSAEWLKWLSPYARLEIREIPDSTADREGRSILRELSRERCRTIALSEEGREFTSAEFAAMLGAADCKQVFIIGGPAGLSREVKARADLIWSLSRLTFTHELARALLCEQLFRAASILHDGQYHNPKKK